MQKRFMLFCLLISLIHLQGNAQSSHKNEKATKGYGKNIISFSPVQLMVNDFNGDADATIGLSYERILDNEMISFKLPVHFSLQKSAFYILPTIKLYTKKQGPVKYALGPQFLIAIGDDSYSTYVQVGPGSGYNVTKEYTRKQFGFLLNHSANFTIAHSFYASIEGAIGIIYADNKPEDYNYYGLSPFGNSSAIQPAFQFNFAMGYRF